MAHSSTLPQGTAACIIGAGCSGLVAAKALQECGIPYDHFEMGSDIGGLWRLDNDNGRAAAYETLHINTSKKQMELADFPMGEEMPLFGHHSDVVSYFEAYADAFDLKESITFNTRVEAAWPTERGRWAVTLDTGETRTYGALIVASGHHWSPNVPDFPGAFGGETMHSRDYQSPKQLCDKRVLIVGIGNSACDIAVDASRVADRAVLSTRRSAWILPKYILGYPLDQWNGPTMERLPLWVRRIVLRALKWMTFGDQERYGVPKPDHRLLEEHPTVSQEILPAVGDGRIDVRPSIERLEGAHVQFEDDRSEPFDLIVYATGYNIRFPFLPDDVMAVRGNQVDLYRHVADPEQPNLYFVGLIQPLGALMPLAELQAKWIAGLLEGRLALPDSSTMRQTIRDARQAMRERYTDSPRHTIQVDFWRYKQTLEQEMREGRQRAKQSGS